VCDFFDDWSGVKLVGPVGPESPLSAPTAPPTPVPTASAVTSTPTSSRKTETPVSSRKRKRETIEGEETEPKAKRAKSQETLSQTDGSKSFGYIY